MKQKVEFLSRFFKFESKVQNQRILCQIEVFKLIDREGLAKFSHINKNSRRLVDARSKDCINF